ncbi:MAG: hypothetical protein Q8S31_09005 [Alphaproteobacteria bacterium]|nr:hypothetical protein [Alphaproteobacteria bacterium]
MIKRLFLISFFSMISTQIVIGAPGRYSLVQIGQNGADGSKGNATLFQTQDGECFGITSAHCLPYLESLSAIKVREMDSNGVVVAELYCPISNIKIHPLYTGKLENKKEDIKYDIALFTIGRHPQLTYFTGDISGDELNKNMEYPVNVTSFGPFFDEDRLSYKENVLHQLAGSLKLSEEGILCRSFQSRDFYLSFSPTEHNEFMLSGGLLSGPGESNILIGDSGSLAVSDDGKPIALVSAVNQDLSNIIQFLELDDYYKDGSLVGQYGETFKSALLEKIENKIARRINFLKESSGKEIYVFRLNEEMLTITGNDYYTHLAPHFNFIADYVGQIKDGSLESREESNTITVVEDAWENPGSVQQICTIRSELGGLKKNEANFKKELSLEDLALIDALFL